MHKKIYGSLKFGSIEDWITFIEGIPADEYSKIEWQADKFAGRFLIPTVNLETALNEVIGDAEKEGYFPLGQEAVLEFCARAIHQDFGVSWSAMQTRIRRSIFWPHQRIAGLPSV